MHKHKDFDKHDPRRVLIVLFAIERMGHDATTHRIGAELDCARIDVKRAIDAAERDYCVQTEKNGSVYRIISWGILDRQKAYELTTQPI